MTYNKTTLFTLIAVLAICICPTISSADIMYYHGMGFKQAVKLYAPGQLANNRTLYAGQFKFTYKNENHLAYCVDLDHWVGTSQVTEVDPADLNNGELAAYLYGNYSSLVDSNTDAAILQVAIWEVLYEDQTPYFDVTDGYFNIRHNSTTEQEIVIGANDLLANMPSSYDIPDDVIVLHSPCKQDVLIPEPTTASIICLGGVILSLRRKRS